MPSRNNVIAISGAHGVGKSTVVRTLCDFYNLATVPPRKPSPFSDQFLAMLFYVLAFAERDIALSEYAGAVVVDRHAARDILVDTWTLGEIGVLKTPEMETIADMVRRLLLPLAQPDRSILLDDEPKAVMRRLKGRPLQAGHSNELEYHAVYLERTLANYRSEWETEAITRGIFGVSLNTAASDILRVSGMHADEIAAAIVATFSGSP